MNIELADIQKELWKILGEADAIYKECADAKIEFTRLDKKEKSKLAIICMKYSDGVMAENKVTRLALASRDYEDFQNEKDIAEARYIAAQSKVNSLEMRAGIARSLQKGYLGEFESIKAFQ